MRASGASGAITAAAGASWVLVLALGLAPVGALADAKAGKDKARTCATCHGTNGLSTQPNAPNLAGQPEVYVVEQLKAYRSGKRNHEVMSVMAKPLSDDDIADLAAWYASLKLEVKEP